MSKIARKTQKIFAGSAANIGEFGSLQDGTKVLSTDPAAIQTSHWVQGMSAAVVSGQNLPALEEINGINFVETYQLAYLFQEGIPEYDAGTTYFINSIVKAPGTYQLYGSKIDNNTGNSLATTADWQFLVDLSNPESNIVWGGTAGGSANTITITPTSALPAYVTPTIVMFLPASNNTGAATLNISSLGAKNITKGGATALSANDLETGKLAFAIYDGTQFQLINNPAFAQGATVTATDPLVLDGAGGDLIEVSGSATINSVTLKNGRFKICRFSGAGAVINFGTNLWINTAGANYTVAAGDIIMFYATSIAPTIRGIIIPINGQSPAALVPQLRTYSSITSGTFTTPANITTSTRFQVELTGGGSGAAGNGAGTSGNAGAAGATVIHEFTGLSPSTGYAYTIGAGSTGGAAGANASTAGGNSTLTWNAVTITANGGALASATPGTVALGGTATGGNIANISGGDGTTGSSVNSSFPGSPGGDSYWGGGGGGLYQGPSGATTGKSGEAPGSGGGSVYNDASAASAGGSGKGGIIRIQYVA